MRNIAETAMLIRGNVVLPDDLNVVTEEFREGWSFVRSGDAHWLDKEVRTHGWHLIRIAEGLVGGGVGRTSQKATASALKLALRGVGERFNAVEVEYCGFKTYPWFVLARVRVFPYRIQQSAVLSVSKRTVPGPKRSQAVSVALTGNQIAPMVS